MKGKIGEKNASSTSTKISLCPQATRHRPQPILIPTSAQTNQPLFRHIVDFYTPTPTQNRRKDLKRIMTPSTLTRKRLIRPLGNYLIQYRRLILRRSQNAPEPLHVLSNRSTPRQHDRHICSGISTPSFKTLLVTTTGNAPLLNRFRISARSFTGLKCVIAGIKKSRLI